MQRRLGCVGLALAALIPFALVPAHAQTEPANDASGWYANFHLIKSQFTDDRHLGYARDAGGTTHVIFPGRDYGLRYRTLAPGARHWRAHTVPGTEQVAYPRLQSALTAGPAGHRLYAAVHRCGVFVISKRAAAPNFPRVGSTPPLVRGCAPSESGESNWEVRDIVAVGRGRVAVLVAKAQTDRIGPEGIFVFLGKPGASWRQTTVTTHYGAGATLLSRDASSGELLVAGPSIEVFSKMPGGQWSDPHTFGRPPSTGSPNFEEHVTGITANHGIVFLAFEHTGRSNRGQYASGKHDDATPLDGVFIARRSRHGQWGDPSRFPTTDQYSLELRLLSDSKRGVIHALFCNADYNHPSTSAGIYQSTHKPNRGWATPTQLTHWWVDVPLQMALTSNGAYRYTFKRGE